MIQSHSDDTCATSSSNHSVLITGGSGLLGRSLVPLLSMQGDTIVSMYRHKLPDPMANVYPVCSDMSSSELIAAPLRGIDTVVHLAWEGGLSGPSGEIDWSFKDGKYTPNLQTTLALITAMERAKTKRIIFVSCVGANRRAQSAFCREKYLAEFFILNSKIEEKIIIRSELLTSKNEDYLSKSVMGLMGYFLYPIPQSSRKINPVFVDDLAIFISRLIRGRTQIKGAVTEFRGAQEITMSELFKLVGKSKIQKRKFAISGSLADYFYPWFEKNQKLKTKFQDILNFENRTDECLDYSNPLREHIPVRRYSYSEVLLSSKVAVNSPIQDAKAMNLITRTDLKVDSASNEQNAEAS